jgi:apolipoprotein N-acyltransferase
MRNEGGRRAEDARSASSPLLRPSLIAFFLGALTVFGFAPFYFFPLPVVTLALLLIVSGHARQARHAGIVGYAYGFGLFIVGVSWVYVSLHDFGAMPAPLAAIATLVFCAFLALFPALAVYLYEAAPFPAWIKLAVWFPALWTLLEWVRSWIFTGFPWLALGYSQIPASPLAAYAPLAGL